MALPKSIANPGGLYGLTADTDDQEVIEIVNNTAGTLLPGDLVMFTTDLTGINAVTTAVANDFTVLGVVMPTDRSLRTVLTTDTYAAGAVMPVCVRGHARINIGANTIAAGDRLTSSGTAKIAQTNTATTVLTAVGSLIGIALEADSAKDARNTIRAYIQKM